MKTKCVLKWSGSKRFLAHQIVSFFPDDIKGAYIEPFCGGCSVLLELISNPEYKNKIKGIKQYTCSDTNRELIEVLKCIKEKPKSLADRYEVMWQVFNLQREKPVETQRKEYYNLIRDQFNREEYDNTWDNDIKTARFYFLTRTSYNGLVRYNSKGDFNSPCHFTRPGMEPSKVRDIITTTSALFNEFNVNFYCIPFDNSAIFSDDFVFIDPPYYDVSKGKMYGNTFSRDVLSEWCNRLICRYALTYNADRGNNKGERLALNNTELILLKGKNSSYSRLKGNSDVIVKELLYVKK
jgi:DNA adenine methylase